MLTTAFGEGSTSVKSCCQQLENYGKALLATAVHYCNTQLVHAFACLEFGVHRPTAACMQVTVLLDGRHAKQQVGLVDAGVRMLE